MQLSISPDQVRVEIEKFWLIMCGKSSGTLEELYSPAALILTGKAKKPETTDLVLVRRARQIAAPEAHAVAELGSVEVEMPAPGLAIASYTYRFHHTRPDSDGGAQRRRTLFGRATQIFQADESGRLWIVHEHLSAATNPETEKDKT